MEAGPDAEHDNGDTGADVPDAHVPDAPVEEDAWSQDGGFCTPEPLAVNCEYIDYGVPCFVPCAFPPTCAFAVTVTWSERYCCTFDRIEQFADCVCEDGAALCRHPFGASGDSRTRPYSTCEFCSRPDSGI
jgi:hypothetical protein